MNFTPLTLAIIEFQKILLLKDIFLEIHTLDIYFIYIERLLKEVHFLTRFFIHTHLPYTLNLSLTHEEA